MRQYVKQTNKLKFRTAFIFPHAAIVLKHPGDCRPVHHGILPPLAIGWLPETVVRCGIAERETCSEPVADIAASVCNFRQS
jgi:hypothetical protein